MSKKIISEVAILRPLALFLVVLHHCFALYSGFWSQIINMDGNDCYWWFGKFVTYFHVELFIFISGYIFAYQNIDLGRRSNFIDFFLSKLKRLYLPCLIFSVVYYFCFYNQGGFDLSNFLLRVTSGCGHLWFLPVLLWCFVVSWIIDHYQYNKFYIFCLLSFCFILPIPYLPMGINVAFHYVFYFYLGYLFWIYQEKFLEYAKFKYISILLVGYLFLVVFNEYVNGFIVNKYILFGVQRVIDYLMSVSGILFVYLLVCHYTCKKDFVLSHKVFYLSSVSYGVYVYHQFLLKCLYYYTSFPNLVGYILLPWVSLVIVIVSSYLLTVLSLKTNIGRFLIG